MLDPQVAFPLLVVVYSTLRLGLLAALMLINVYDPKRGDRAAGMVKLLLKPRHLLRKRR